MTVISRGLGFIVFIIFLVAIVFNIAVVSGSEELIESMKSKAAENKTEEKAEVEKVEQVEGLPEYASVKDYDRSSMVLVNDVDVVDIKQLLADGHPVIALLDTTVLNNPFYDEYDFVYATIVGYSDTHFNTKESGIKRGGEYVYLIEDFMKALEATGGDVLYLN